MVKIYHDVSKDPPLSVHRSSKYLWRHIKCMSKQNASFSSRHLTGKHVNRCFWSLKQTRLNATERATEHITLAPTRPNTVPLFKTLAIPLAPNTVKQKVHELRYRYNMYVQVQVTSSRKNMVMMYGFYL